MMNKSILVKTFACLFSTALAAGYTYSSPRFKPQTIDVSAFKNAANNFSHIVENKHETNFAQIVKSETASANQIEKIEKGVQEKIVRTRYALKPIKKINFDHLYKKQKNIGSSLSAFEINNKELIRLYAFDFETTFYKKVKKEKSPVEKIEKPQTGPEVVEKVFEERLAGVDTHEESTQPANEVASVEETKPTQDDLVLYDYSEKSQEKGSPKKFFDGRLSNTVKDVIKREISKSASSGTRLALNTQAKSKGFLPLEKKESEVPTSEDEVVYDYSNEKSSAVAKEESENFLTGTSTQSDFIIRANRVDLSTHKTSPLYGYEFVPDYLREERTDDKGTGEIKLGYSLADSGSTQTGIIQSRGHISTRVELNLLSGEMNIPLFNEEDMQKFLESKSLSIVGNLLMASLEDSVDDIEIDSKYQVKLYFNDQFKVQPGREGSTYALFLGVQTGNVLMRYELKTKETAQKIVYVGDGEMYFEASSFVSSQREIYTLSTRNLLGKKSKELNIDADKISFFGSEGKTKYAKKKAVNAYELKVPTLVENARKYLEFGHMNTSLFVGTSRESSLEVPGQDFLDKVLQANDLNGIGERCIVQINLTKDLLGFKVNGKNRLGEMFVETSFLDRDGNFSRENLELAEKAFITGDMEGMFNVRLDYADGSSQFLKTFCTEGAYLIEQL